MTSILEQVLTTFGRREIVKFRDVTAVENAIAKIAEKGPGKLQVIADFDSTLSRHHVNGVRCDSSPGVLTRSKLMPEEFKKTGMALFHKYYPIEICHELTVDEKIPHMVEWYTQSQANIVKAGFTKTRIREFVAGSTCILRENTNHMLKVLHDANIPVLVFSAGVGNVLEEVLAAAGALFPNKKIVSNFMEFDDEERILAFKKPLIHTFNKHEIASMEVEYFASVAERNNVLLLGDCLGDHEMDKGVQNPDAVLKIGFLNDRLEERLPAFMEAFDIVILDDQSMDFVNALLKFILKQ